MEKHRAYGGIQKSLKEKAIRFQTQLTRTESTGAPAHGPMRTRIRLHRSWGDGVYRWLDLGPSLEESMLKAFPWQQAANRGKQMEMRVKRSLGKTRNCAGQQVSGLEFKGGNLVFFLLSFYFKLWHWFVGTIINHGLSKITELGILVDMECSCRPITPQEGRAPAIKRGFFPPPTKRDLRGTSISLLQEVFTSVIFVVKSVNVHVLSSK